jgi:hypothetical protein
MVDRWPFTVIWVFGVGGEKGEGNVRCFFFYVYFTLVATLLH